MWCLKTFVVFLVTLTLVRSMTVETNSTRLKESVQNNTILSNSTVILDVRTPPKVQNQIKEKISSKYSTETSHAGVAIPVIDDADLIEETTPKIHKVNKSSTSTTTTTTATSTTANPNEGLSTWILLSGQTTSKPLTNPQVYNKKPLARKPAFIPRSTTPKPLSSSRSTTTTTTTVRINTFSPPTKTSPKPTNLTKVKASVLQKSRVENGTVSTTKLPQNVTSTTPTTELTTLDSSKLPIEAKDGEQELPVKKKKKSHKRKNNKKGSNNNKLKEAESPGTQLYSYLRSEIIPVTVGVSLVGLLVTAGLASYYLQPFAALRRNDPVDRKDTEGTYYYQDDYSNAMPEEEAIGKVIAGMPLENTLPENSYNKANNNNNYKYRQVNHRSQIFMNPYGSVKDVAVNYDASTTSEAPPAVVPEHGPRNLNEDMGKFIVFSSGASPRRLRVRRDIVPNDAENEIVAPDEMTVFPTTTTDEITTQEVVRDTTQEIVQDTTPHNVFNPNQRPNTFFELFMDMFRLKLNLGLEFIQNVGNSFTNYITKAHHRLDEFYRHAKKNHTIH